MFKNLCLLFCKYVPVVGAVGAGVVYSNNKKDMLEMGPDVLRGERQRSRLLKDYGYNVITYVPLPQELGGERKNTK